LAFLSKKKLGILEFSEFKIYFWNFTKIKTADGRRLQTVHKCHCEADNERER
jgi:hypothetical protein